MKYETEITDGLKQGFCCRHLRQRVQPDRPKQFSRECGEIVRIRFPNRIQPCPDCLAEAVC
jgi:hypothetical protein